MGGAKDWRNGCCWFAKPQATLGACFGMIRGWVFGLLRDRRQGASAGAGQKKNARPSAESSVFEFDDWGDGLGGGGDVGEEAEEAGALDGLGDHALFHGGYAGALAGEDLTIAADELAEGFGVFVVDEGLAAGGLLGGIHLGAVEGLEFFGLFAAFAIGIAGACHGHCSDRMLLDRLESYVKT